MDRPLPGLQDSQLASDLVSGDQESGPEAEWSHEVAPKEREAFPLALRGPGSLR